MKNIRASLLVVIILAFLAVTCFFMACNHGGAPVDPGSTESTVQTDAADETEAPVITASPDGEVTASPTKEPEDPNATDEVSGTGEAATEPAGSTEHTGTEPAATGGTQPSGNPITTVEPGGTSSATDSPIGTSLPLPSGGGQLTTPRPGTTPGPTVMPTATTDPYSSPTCPPINSYEAHYAGAVVDCAELKVGDSFYWTFDLVNEHSRLWSGHWLIDYNERYLRVDAYSTSWSGGITYQITQTWDDDNPSSDKPAIVCNPEYMGQTGGKPLGVEDNMYANTGMYLTSFQFYGVQSAGSLIRFKFVVKELPKNSAMKHDGDGYYLEIPVLVYESTATIDSPIYPGVYTSEDHGIVTCEPGKLYFAH